MPQITKSVRAATLAMLSDAAGFNAKLAAIATAYSLGDAARFQVDWSGTSKQFFAARIDPDDADQTTQIKYPVVALYAESSANQHNSKPRKFSGEVTLILDYWSSIRGVRKEHRELMETLGDAIEDTIADLTADGNWPALWGSPYAVNVSEDMSRGEVEPTAENLRQLLSFRLVFEIDTN